jgi:hypothetical protein
VLIVVVVVVVVVMIMAMMFDLIGSSGTLDSLLYWTLDHQKWKTSVIQVHSPCSVAGNI